MDDVYVHWFGLIHIEGNWGHKVHTCNWMDAFFISFHSILLFCWSQICHAKKWLFFLPLALQQRTIVFFTIFLAHFFLVRLKDERQIFVKCIYFANGFQVCSSCSQSFQIYPFFLKRKRKENWVEKEWVRVRVRQGKSRDEFYLQEWVKR